MAFPSNQTSFSPPQLHQLFTSLPIFKLARRDRPAKMATATTRNLQVTSQKLRPFFFIQSTVYPDFLASHFLQISIFSNSLLCLCGPLSQRKSLSHCIFFTEIFIWKRVNCFHEVMLLANNIKVMLLYSGYAPLIQYQKNLDCQD